MPFASVVASKMRLRVIPASNSRILSGLGLSDRVQPATEAVQHADGRIRHA